MEDTQRLVTEIEMLKVVLYLVSRSRRKPVNDDGWIVVSKLQHEKQYQGFDETYYY
jgi:hypothetical protein